MAPGILWAATRPKNNDTLPDDKFNEWYDKVHLGDVLDSKVPDFALRYKNLNPDGRPFSYTAIYNVPDIKGVDSEEFAVRLPPHSKPDKIKVALF